MKQVDNENEEKKVDADYSWFETEFSDNQQICYI